MRGFNKVFTNNIALSNTPGQAAFYVNESVATNSLYQSKNTDSFVNSLVKNKEIINVETAMLDDYCRNNDIQRIHILKMDVQGSELMILEGAVETLKAKKINVIYCEIWFKEVYSGQPFYPEIAVFLKKYGYDSFGIYNMHYRKDGQFLWGDAIFISRDLQTA